MTFPVFIGSAIFLLGFTPHDNPIASQASRGIREFPFEIVREPFGTAKNSLDKGAPAWGKFPDIHFLGAPVLGGKAATMNANGPKRTPSINQAQPERPFPLAIREQQMPQKSQIRMNSMDSIPSQPNMPCAVILAPWRGGPFLNDIPLGIRIESFTLALIFADSGIFGSVMGRSSPVSGRFLSDPFPRP